MTTFRSDRHADEHAGHDRQMVVAYACGDLDAADTGAARTLIHECRRCAALANEISLLRASLATDLGAPRRHRDFRLGAEDADRLRAGPLSRLLRRLGGPGTAVLQPLAGAALAIGLVLVVTTGALPSLRLGAGGAAVVPAAALDLRAGPAAGSGADGTATPAKDGQSAPAAVTDGESTATPGAPERDQSGVIDTPTQPMKSIAAPSEPTIDPGLLAGIGLLLVGGAVLVVRLAARRIAEDPLLR
jgi:hypothetical protein